MKKSPYIILLIVIQSLAIFCCKDDDSSPATRTELLTKSWKVGEVTINSTPDVQTDYSDDKYIFKPDGTYTIDNGNGNVESGTWNFNSNETKLILDEGTANEETVDIFRLTHKELIVEVIIPATWKEGQKTMRVVLKV